MDEAQITRVAGQLGWDPERVRAEIAAYAGPPGAEGARRERFIARHQEWLKDVTDADLFGWLCIRSQGGRGTPGPLYRPAPLRSRSTG